MKTDILRVCALNEKEARYKAVETLYFLGVDVQTSKIEGVQKIEGKDSYNVIIKYDAKEYNRKNKKEKLLKEKAKLEGIKDYTKIVNQIMGKDVKEEKEALEFRPIL